MLLYEGSVCIVCHLQLLEPEESKLGDGKIRDSNRITLITLLGEMGIQATDLGIAKDRQVLFSDISDSPVVDSSTHTAQSTSLQLL